MFKKVNVLISKLSIKALSLLIAFIFFAAGALTLPHYGINWDTINHLPRGQAYLRYFLTGKKDYSDLPEFFNGWQKEGQWYWQKPESLGIDADIPRSQVPARSMYQLDAMDYAYFMEHDGGGHPPLSDIISSSFNRVLFGKLRLINDIDSYRVYGIFLAAILVGLIYYWTTKVYGGFAGLISAIALSTYPIFWAESHYNTEKDIPETVFFGLVLFSFWKGIVSRNWKWVLVSGVFAGLALGTKFNALFVVFIILPWFVYYLFRNKSFKKNLKHFFPSKLLILSLVIAPFIALFIFIATWPYLWPDIISRVMGVVGFYKNIGITKSIDPNFTGLLGINTYPLIWILYTTPIITIFLAFIGFIRVLGKIFIGKETASFVFLLWFLVPIARVAWPGASIYGGVRQIMEYIPAMAILAGVGALYIYQKITKISNKTVACLVLFTPFLLLVVNLYKIHPNENVYFNSLIGGLSGAKEKDIPYWGFSFGSPYRQAAVWINKNVEQGADLVFTFDLIPNLSRIWLRQDINLHNTNRSGYFRKGEYAMGLVYDGTAERSYYDAYLEKFQKPVYEVKVNGVAILKIWKNDIKHTRKGYLNEEGVKNITITRNEQGLRIDLGKTYTVSKLEAKFNNNNCEKLNYAYSQISKDGFKWARLAGTMPDEDWNTPVLGPQPKSDSFIQPFAAEKLRYIDYIIFPTNSCLKNVYSLSVYYLPEVNN